MKLLPIAKHVWKRSKVRTANRPTMIAPTMSKNILFNIRVGRAPAVARLRLRCFHYLG